MSEPLRILLIDDDRDDYVLTRDLLGDGLGGPFALDWASSYDAGLEMLGQRRHDVCLLDFRLGRKTGLDLLRDPAAVQSGVPIILLTGQGQREIDLQAMQAGAADYLTKDSLEPITLERTIRHALERHRDHAALRQMNEQLESRVEERTKALEKANAALQEADHRKDEFLATLAHELRNPLAPITNSLEVMKQSEGDMEIARNARATMERQLKQMVRLIDDLLEVSRISRGKIVLKKQRVDLASIVHHAEEAARPLYALRNQCLTLSLPIEPVQVDADPTRLAQIIGNLLNNASKFTDAGGTVELVVTSEPAGDIVIAVRDNGIGIAADQLARIFGMFTQVDSSLERSEGGLGIGLTLVKTLVEMHGGSIRATSPGLGQGSEFVVRLPKSNAPAPQTGGQAPKTEPRRGPVKQRILVVDDNTDSATSMAMLLKFSGHEVATAFDGHEALAQAAAFTPTVILLDIGLPGLNGYEVARSIRQKPEGKPITIVALTGWGQEEDRQKSKDAGFDHHLTKPVDHTTLMKLLDGLV